MRSLKSFNIDLLDTYTKSLDAIENQLIDLIDIVSECPEPFTVEDNQQFINNINWLKRFYEAAEKGLLNGNK